MSSDSENEVNFTDPYRYDPGWEEHHAKAVDVRGKVLSSSLFVYSPYSIVRKSFFDPYNSCSVPQRYGSKDLYPDPYQFVPDPNTGFKIF